MNFHKQEVKRVLEESVAKHAEKEGLTLAVLTDIAQDLKKREDSLVAQAFQACTVEYASAAPPDDWVDQATLQFGGIQPSSRKEQKQLHTLAAQHHKILTRLKEAGQEAESLRNAAHLHQQLTDFDRLSGTGQYADAARCIVSAAGSLLRHSDYTEDSEEARLRDEFAERGSCLAKDLAHQIDQAITCGRSEESGSAEIYMKGCDQLSKAWLALQILQEGDSSLQKLAQDLLGTLDLDHRLPSGARVDSSGAVKKIEAELTGGEDDVQQEDVRQALTTILDFVGEFGLGNNESLCKAAGQLLWPSIARTYIWICLKSFTSSGDDALLLERQAKAAEAFEDDIVNLGFLERSQHLTEPLPIHAHTQQMQDTLLRRRKLDLVSRARALMLLPLHETTSVGLPLGGTILEPIDAEHQHGNGAMGRERGGTGARRHPNMQGDSDNKLPNGIASGPDAHEEEHASLLAAGEYQISRTLSQIMDVVRAGLQSAAERKSSIDAQACLLALVEIAELYSAIPPTVWLRELQVPVVAAIYRNNCYHLAQEILLQPCYYPSLQFVNIKHPDEVLECIKHLRRSGSAVLHAVVQQQTVELQEILAGAEGFKRISEAKRGLRARKVVQQVLHTLRQLGSNLRPVLPPGAFIQLGADLIASPAESAVGSVMSSTDISVDESEDLPRILDPLANESAAAFTGSISDAGKSPTQQTVCAIVAACKPLQRLQAVLEIMGAKLGKIRSMWEEGKLECRGLTSLEVVHLIKALFEETDLRDAVIADVQS